MKIAITAIIGGPDAEKIVKPSLLSLRKRLEPLEKIEHSSELDTLRLKLGVSGSISKFKEANGCSGFRIVKKSRYASAELTMHQDIWKQGDRKVTAYLDELVTSAVAEITKRCAKSGVDLEAQKLLSDLETALQH